MENGQKKELSGESSKQMVAQPNSYMQVFDPQRDIDQATVAAKALMSVMKQKPKKVIMNGEQYLEFEDWQTIGQFFQTTVGTDWTKEIVKDGKVYGYEAKSNLYNKDGLIIGGSEASCNRDELNWKVKPDFQLKSMAQTRANAKALRSRFGFVAVLGGFRPTPAEEIDDSPYPTNAPVTSTAPSKGINPSKSQMDLIASLMKQRGYTQDDIIAEGFGKLTGGKGGTASELIDFLMEAKSKIINGQIQ